MIFRFLLFGLLPFLPAHPVKAPSEPANIATSATLSASPDPALLGQPVTLTAVLQPPDAGGSVTFYSGVSFLGVASVEAGQAVLTTALLPAGTNLLTARFNSDRGYDFSTAPILPLEIGVTPGTGFPGGVVYPVGQAPTWVATADLNNDGIADILTANAGAETVSVFLGNGDGTFTQMPDAPTGIDPLSVIAADFNGDGIPDLAVINSGDPSVSILLGNGDGTFQAPGTWIVGSEPVAAVIADFDLDGNADIAVIDANNDTVTILIGSGDGEFTIGNSLFLGVSPQQITAADFNGDGIPDLAIAGSAPDGVAVLLGNGDGTFTRQTFSTAGTSPSSIAAADFNGDGLPDLAVGALGDLDSLNGGGVDILLGNGDGSFQPPILAVPGPNVFALAVADFDGDGLMDLGVISSDGFSTYSGNGDGTMQPAQSYSAGDSPISLAIGSFDGQGLTEVAVVNQTESELDILTGSPGDCSYSLSPASLLYDGSSVSNVATLTASATGCPWTAGGDPWIVPQVTTGLGGGPINFQVQANTTGYDRSGSLVIAGQTLTITQRFTTTQFSDVPPSAYYFDAVNLLKNKNITAGCGTGIFCPTEQVSRAQMAIFIVNAVYGGSNFTYNPTPYFSDVPPNALGFKWIQKLYELGVTSGCGPGIYCPNNGVTRAQMAVFVIRGRFSSTVSFSFPPTAYFTDVPVGAFAFGWIQRMRLEGITDGCNVTLYCPASPVTRGDMSIFIMRGLFNALYPPGNPTLVSISPPVLIPGQPGTFQFTGANTSFAAGQTTITTATGITVSNVLVSSPTTLSVDLSADSTAPLQPVGLVAITGAEQDVLPNGLVIQ